MASGDIPNYVKELSEAERSKLRDTWAALFERVNSADFIASVDKAGSSAGESGSSVTTGAGRVTEGLVDMLAFDDLDGWMVRFLRARKWDTAAAIEMMTSTLKWRISTNIKGIVEAGERCLDEQWRQSGVFYVWGQDLEGRAIVYLNARYFRPPKTAERQEALKRYMYFYMEVVRLLLRDRGVFVVGDLTGFGRENIVRSHLRAAQAYTGHKDLEFGRIFSETFQSHYPEILSRAVIVGTGFKMVLFESVWKVAKHFLDVNVQRKISFSNPKHLDQYINNKFVPKHHGGEFDPGFIVSDSGDTTSGAIDTAAKKEIVTKELEAWKEFEETTRAWIKDPTATDIQRKRDEAKTKVRELWLQENKLRPRNLYQRMNLLNEEGVVNWNAVM